jgi:hypothetical protein
MGIKSVNVMSSSPFMVDSIARMTPSGWRQSKDFFNMALEHKIWMIGLLATRDMILEGRAEMSGGQVIIKKAVEIEEARGGLSRMSSRKLRGLADTGSKEALLEIQHRVSQSIDIASMARNVECLRKHGLGSKPIAIPKSESSTGAESERFF